MATFNMLSRANESTSLLPLFTPSPLDSIPIYSLVLDIYDLFVERVDISLKYEQLKSPQIHSFLIRPLVAEIKPVLSAGTLYALMANMLQFNKESYSNTTMNGVMCTRALVCEIVAIKLLKEYSEDDLMNALTYDFYPLAQGSYPYKDQRQAIIPRWQRISTLEVAIKASAKRFLAHPAVVQVLQEIWNGSVMFQSSLHKLHRNRVLNNDDLAAMGYGRRGPGIRYKYEESSLLKLSRLRVPRYRHLLNLASFGVLLALYIIVLSSRSKSLTLIEIFFWIWSLGFILDEIVGFNDAGFTLYVISLWNLFDLVILLLLVSYASLRILSLMADSLYHDHDRYLKLSSLAYDMLATVAIFIFPRLFSVLDNYQSFSQMIIAARQMSIDLIKALVAIIVISSGFWVAFTLAFARDVFSADQVAFDLLRIFFGFTPAVWDTWQYYSVLGRVILLTYLFVTHFLAITIMVAVLSTSFANISSNANEEHQYLFAVNTITMIKSESSSLFSYAAPLNLVEWAIRPLVYVLPLHSFLVLNRTVIKITHFPVLFIIFIYERTLLRFKQLKEKRLADAENERRLYQHHIRQNSLVPTQAYPRQSRPTSSQDPATHLPPGRKVKRHAKKNKVNPNSSKSKISNDDLLDEVFKRPYKGTIRVRSTRKSEDQIDQKPWNNDTLTKTSRQKSYGSKSGRGFSDYNSDPEDLRRTMDEVLLGGDEDDDADSEHTSDKDDDIPMSPETRMLYPERPNKVSLAANRFSRHTTVLPSVPSGIAINKYPAGETTSTNTHLQAGQSKRARLFSNTSSIYQQGIGNTLSISPARSTASFLDRHLWSQGNTKFASSKHAIDDAEDSEEEDDDGTSLPTNTAELQDMTRLIMGRMDLMEVGMRNIELLLQNMSENANQPIK